MKKLILSILIIFFLSCDKEESEKEVINPFQNYIEFEGSTFTLSSGKTINYPVKFYELNHGIISRSFDTINNQYYYGILLLSDNAIISEIDNGTIIDENGKWNGVFLNGFSLSDSIIEDGAYTFDANSNWGKISSYAVSEVLTEIGNNGGYSNPLKSASITLQKSGNNYQIQFSGVSLITDKKINGLFNGELNIRKTNTTMLSFWNKKDFKNCFVYNTRSYELKDCILKNIEKPRITFYSESILATDDEITTNSYYNGTNVLQLSDNVSTGRKLSTGTYRIGYGNIYKYGYLGFEHSSIGSSRYSNQARLTSGVFNVCLKEDIIEFALNGKTKDGANDNVYNANDNLFLFYNGSYRTINE